MLWKTTLFEAFITTANEDIHVEDSTKVQGVYIQVFCIS